ncbi:hypothetical protein BB559_001711 [Furculomyces boomerangus]|uniref:Inhibitor I9 domain-containing protein n=2 Tax=Harpellales TaxID=61421 RepID=A0A2T9Y5P5_9FUNG|nr:hypothetical protein BB559_005940 [Furculomyces boomerangus]PVU98226.1 hypothetical protein BB559_001711 [Furculomyces boomerangus]PVZ96522.1 hypothetical protein BB558_007559 [Smittium angustum]
MNFTTLILYFLLPIVSLATDVCPDAKLNCKNPNSNPSLCVKNVEGYIVVLNPGFSANGDTSNTNTLSEHVSWIKEEIKDYAINNGASSVGFGQEFSIGSFIGYNANLNVDLVSRICNRKDVKYVEHDLKVTIS